MSKRIELEVRLNKTINVEIELDEILAAINDLPILKRLNVVGGLVNNIEVFEEDEVTDEQKEIIINWCKKVIKRFEE